MPLDMDSPYQISKVVGEFYAVYYHSRHGLPTVRARFQNVYGPGEILGAGRWRGTPATVWRNVTPTFVYRALKQPAAPSSKRRRWPAATSSTSTTSSRGLILCATRGAPGDVYNLASGTETTILRARDADQRADRQPDAVQSGAGARLGSLGQALRQHRKAKRELGFAASVPLEEGLQTTPNGCETTSG